MSRPRVKLVLADGESFEGEGFGAPPATPAGSGAEGPAAAPAGSGAEGRAAAPAGSGAEGRALARGAGEVVFHTGMTGYQEILTDPSYAGQIVCMTYPEIGNVGTNPEDEESHGVFLRGFVVREYNERPSSWRSHESLEDYLVRHEVPGISGIDTRALVRHIRSAGAINGVIVPAEVEPGLALRLARGVPPMEGRNLVDEVSCREPYVWTEGSSWPDPGPPPEPRLPIVAYDFGIKRNILRRLVDTGFEVSVVPARTPAREVIARAPAGVFLSNGPGDPGAVEFAVDAVRSLARELPIFGICLGHQILGLALGGRRRKLRFGHHGANQPALDQATGRVMITSENHGFALDPDSLAELPEVEVTHRNLNDACVEGLRHTRLPLCSVQYHPEASPGPHDTSPLFDVFRQLIEDRNAPAH